MNTESKYLWEKWNPIVSANVKYRLNENALTQPFMWKEKRIVEIDYDFFKKENPIDYKNFYELYKVIQSSPHHIFLLSTANPDAMDMYLTLFATQMNLEDEVTVLCPNLLKGLLVSSQQEFDIRRTYISHNPLLINVLFLKNISTYINITEWLDYYDPYFVDNTEKTNPIQWIIIEGGEKPIHPNWIRDIIKFGSSYSIPVYFKSWGEWIPAGTFLSYDTPDIVYLNQNGDISKTDENIVNVVCLKRVGKMKSGCLLNEVLYHEIPIIKKTISR
ncbi:MAG: DUF5131 family protein [bacterium]|nr:DUF5131 family protein [bacterium]